MQFDSLAAALAMDGHGPYVWTVVVVSVVVIAGLLLAPASSSRRFLREQRTAMGRGAQGPAERAAPTAVIEEVNNAPGA